MNSASFLTDIPADLARRAYDGVSMSPERRGDSTRREYAEQLAADFTDLAKIANTPEKLAQLETEFARYREGYRRRLLAYLQSNARCVSWFIAGPSNFPVARMQKRSNVAHRRLEDLSAFRSRALDAIRKALCPELRPVMAGDADAVDRLQLQITQAKQLQEKMRDANAAIRKHKAAGAEAQIIALVSLGISETQARELLTPDFVGRIGFPDYELTNNGANIRRMERRAEGIAAAKARPNKVIEGTAARMEDCPADNRVRLFFPGKPSAEIRTRLKSSGFRWAPTVGAWQAYRSALDRAREFVGIAVGTTAIASKAENPAAAAAPRPAFSETDCSGVFDGFAVHSDADPGL